METSNISGWGVMLLGMGIVFLGLVMLIYITKLMSFFCTKGMKKEQVPAVQAQAAQAAPVLPNSQAIANRPQFVAAIAVAIATVMGTEPEGLRIHSITKK
ncbi:OadG family protein [Eubacteriales bacterium OttesenSCG-928-K08]|nr:OadG family protein [Eubacteriales bacterium OttesenSCG-928-K08]